MINDRIYHISEKASKHETAEHINAHLTTGSTVKMLSKNLPDKTMHLGLQKANYRRKSKLSTVKSE